jgi:hypothetical protein
MRPARILAFLLTLLGIYLPLHARSKHLIVTGKLIEVSADAAEPAAWAIQLNPVITIEGRQLSTLEVKTPHPQKLESLQDAFVQAKGTLLTDNTTDAALFPVLELVSIHSVKYNNPDKDNAKLSFWTSLSNFFFSPI